MEGFKIGSPLVPSSTTSLVVVVGKYKGKCQFVIPLTDGVLIFEVIK